MAIDLTLIALPAAGRFALDKARTRPEYADNLARIVEPDAVRNFQDAARLYPRDFSEALSLELQADAKQLQPLQLPEPTEFHSLSRSYATIDYLLDKWLRAHGQPHPVGQYVFYSGNELDNNGQRIYSGYLLPEQVAAIHAILSQIKFADLLVHYDYERMNEEGVYKLTSPDRLIYMKKEYKMLRAFFWAAHAAGSFVLIELC